MKIYYISNQKILKKEVTKTTTPKYTPEVVPIKFAPALQAAKQPKHCKPLADGVPVSDEGTNELISSMLGSLNRYQLRAIEKDPVHGKLKLRFVSGLKQALNGVKSGRARLVLLAIDTEESEALDEKFNTLLVEAKQKEIPVLYCMTRRKLAKSIGSSFRQSAVAVYDPDGAYPEYKKVIAFIEKAHELLMTDASRNLKT